MFGARLKRGAAGAAAARDDEDSEPQEPEPEVPGEYDEELAGLEPEEGEQQPQEHLRRRPRHREQEEEQSDDNTGGPPEPTHLRKRPRHREEEDEQHEEQQAQPAEPAPPAPDNDQVAAALRRITSHIGNPAKFAKASPLLRQLLESGTLSKQHRQLVFDAVRAVYSLKPGAHKHLVDPMNRREVLKLMSAVEALLQAGFFVRVERAQIVEVYQPLGVLCNELQTDDSFVFSKVMARLRELVDRLPEVEEPQAAADDAAHLHVTQDLLGSAATGQGPSPTGVQQQAEAPPATPAPAPAPKPASAPAADEEEDDPFGLGALMEAPKLPPQAPAPPKPPSKPPEPATSAWGPSEMMVARRCAVLTAVQHAKTFHKHVWAQTSIELLVEHCWQNKSRFSRAQHAELDSLWVWVRKAKAARKLGPSAKEVNRDSTSFERARAEWSKATVSHRGKVGANADAKSANWLG